MMPFITADNKSSNPLSSVFLNDLDSDYCKDTIAPVLARIIRQYITCKKNNRAGFLGFWPLNIDGTKCYVVMVHFIYDRVLINLAQECGMPRGFPIVWFPGKAMYLYGFRPKFENDERQSDESGILSQAESLDIMPKLSGFLGQIIIFPHNGTYFAVTCSKNSTGKGNKFALDAERIVKSWLSEDLITQLGQEQLYICGEVMSYNDQVHGSHVLREEFIVTTIGKCLVLDLISGQHTGRSFKSFTCHMSHRDLNFYCTKHNIPVTEIWSVHKNIPIFVAELAQSRDTMTLNKFYDFIELHKDNITFYPGTIHHEDVLGQVLEGIVIWLNNNKLTIKYKFPEYTHRTFCYREWIKNNLAFRSDNINNFMLFLNSYLEHWVVTPQGKEYWKHRILSQLIQLKLSSQLDQILTDSGAVGTHILLAESDWDCCSQDDTNILDKFNEVFGATQENIADIVLFLGPIGVGKSVRSQQYVNAKTCGNYVLIDGDDLGIKSENVMKMGQERNFYTKYCINKAIINGQVPVVSTGGGALIERKANNLMVDMINMCGVSTRIHLFLPCNKDVIKKFYNEWDVEAIIKNRLKTGEWTCENNTSGFINKISKRSRNNNEFAEIFTTLAYKTYMYPPIVNYKEDINDVSWIPDIKHRRATPPTTFNLQQLRLLCRVNYKSGDFCMGHITIFYSQSPKQVKLERLKQLETLKGTYEGNLYKCASWSLVHVALDNSITHLDPEATHITINSGQHAPKEMKTACKQLVSGINTILLPLKSGEIKSYDSELIHKENVSIIILDVLPIA